jgi:hypothetical protein
MQSVPHERKSSMQQSPMNGSTSVGAVYVLVFSEVRLPHARHTGAPVSGVAVLSEGKPRGPILFDTTADTTQGTTPRNGGQPSAKKSAYLSGFCNRPQRPETDDIGLWLRRARSRFPSVTLPQVGTHQRCALLATRRA